MPEGLSNLSLVHLPQTQNRHGLFRLIQQGHHLDLRHFISPLDSTELQTPPPCACCPGVQG